MFYTSICPETNRAFVCHTDKNDNIAETFDYEGKKAAENARMIARALNTNNNPQPQYPDPIEHVVRDAAADGTDESIVETRIMKITTDQHGCVISITGTEEGIVVDLKNNVLSVYRSDENSDVTGNAAIQLALATTSRLQQTLRTLWETYDECREGLKISRPGTIIWHAAFADRNYEAIADGLGGAEAVVWDGNPCDCIEVYREAFATEEIAIATIRIKAKAGGAWEDEEGDVREVSGRDEL